MTTPLFKTHLPDLWLFITDLAEAHTTGRLNNWSALAAEVRHFFTQARMDATEAVIPGWHKMASYENGQTLIHVMAVLTSFLLSPDYQSATLEHQNLMLWTGLFHDIEKEIHQGRRDPTHAFRSAAATGRQLPRLGFALRDEVHLAEWVEVTRTAVARHPETGEQVQDNQRLPAILSGIENLFGQDTPAALIVKAVLLHMSINVLAEWPQAAPLTDQAARQSIDDSLLPLLRAMMIADNDAYAFFDYDLKQRQRTETLLVFDRIGRLNTDLMP